MRGGVSATGGLLKAGSFARCYVRGRSRCALGRSARTPYRYCEKAHYICCLRLLNLTRSGIAVFLINPAPCHESLSSSLQFRAGIL